MAGDDALTDPLCRIALLAWQEARPARSAGEAAAVVAGSYEGLPAQVALLGDGRSARLLAPIRFLAPDGTAWDVPAGAALDGASIPRLFWTLIGGPFEGLYRDASIVHDHYCVTRSRDWRRTHRMFYDAMRASGVGVARAKVMFYAVFRFGPRWPEPGTAAVAREAAVRPAADAPAIETAAADAEAIYLQDLSLDEIETLAEARTAAARSEAATAPPLQRAQRLVIPGGSGTAADLNVVAAEVARLPDPVLALFERRKIRVVACRGSVTDFERRLRGVVPRGWEGTGRTWDSVPGTYFDEHRRVVIATIGEGERRAVPTRESRLHGSANLVVHEALHGYDYALQHAPIGQGAFVAARAGDLPRLGDYERQPGQAGLEETFAESGARFVGEAGAMQGNWPNLFGYWQSGAATTAAESAAAPSAPAPQPAALGTAALGSDGAITLDLRAEGDGGAIGHAMLRIEGDEPAYARLRQHLFGAESAAGGAGGTVPFRPLPQGN